MVLTKFIEGPGEVEMDAVGKDGRVSVASPPASPVSAFHQFFPWQFRNIAQIRAHDFYKNESLIIMDKLLSQKNVQIH